MTADRLPDWIFPDADVNRIHSAMQAAMQLGEDCRSRVLSGFLGDPATFDRRDTRYLYFIRAYNVGTGLLALVKALRSAVNQPDFLEVEPGHDPAREKVRIMNNMVGPIIFWGATLNWWGNYEHCTVSVAQKAGWRIPGRPGLHRLKDIGEALAPRQGSGPLSCVAEWRAHWDMSSTLRNLVHNGGVFNPTFAAETITCGGVSVNFRPGKIPDLPRELWLMLFHDSVKMWGAVASHPDVISIREEIPDLHCGAREP